MGGNLQRMQQDTVLTYSATLRKVLGGSGYGFPYSEGLIHAIEQGEVLLRVQGHVDLVLDRQLTTGTRQHTSEGNRLRYAETCLLGVGRLAK